MLRSSVIPAERAINRGGAAWRSRLSPPRSHGLPTTPQAVWPPCAHLATSHCAGRVRRSPTVGTTRPLPGHGTSPAAMATRRTGVQRLQSAPELVSGWPTTKPQRLIFTFALLRRHKVAGRKLNRQVRQELRGHEATLSTASHRTHEGRITSRAIRSKRAKLIQRVDNTRLLTLCAAGRTRTGRRVSATRRLLAHPPGDSAFVHVACASFVVGKEGHHEV
jgi:hypothetical protein